MGDLDDDNEDEEALGEENLLEMLAEEEDSDFEVDEIELESTNDSDDILDASDRAGRCSNPACIKNRRSKCLNNCKSKNTS